MKVLIVLSIVALAAASGDYSKSSYVYQGKYSGKCGNDGLYYRDENSFVFCSNDNSYVQPCAPGTRNSGYDKYSSGGSYSYRDFCDVNLVDYGYGAAHNSYGNNNRRDSGYGRRDYGYDGRRNNGYGRRDSGYGRRDNGYGRRDDGYGRRDRGYGYGDRRGH